MTASALPTTLFLPDAPTVPGLTFRFFRGEADFPAMVEVFEASKTLDELDFVITLDDIKRQFTHLENCDPYRDMLIAEVDGEMVAYSRVYWEQESDGDRIYGLMGLMKPAWRRKGIGTAMWRHGEQRLREIARDHPPELPKYLQRGAYASEVGLVALLEQEGYTPIRYGFEMLRPINVPLTIAPMPEGLEVRPVRSEDVRTVMAATDEAFRDHWGHRPLTEDDIHQWMEERIFNPSLWMVAWDGDQVAGSVLNFVDQAENETYNRRRGYTETISVRRPWRRRGLARSLLTQSIQMFKEMGMQETALGVDTQNPSGALNLYESVGYRMVKRHVTYRKAMA